MTSNPASVGATCHHGVDLRLKCAKCLSGYDVPDASVGPAPDGFDQRQWDFAAMTAIAAHLRENPAKPYSGRQCEEFVQFARDQLYAPHREAEPTDARYHALLAERLDSISDGPGLGLLGGVAIKEAASIIRALSVSLPVVQGNGSLQASPSVPTEGHEAAVLDKHQLRAIEHAAMDAGAYSWRRARLAMVEDGKVIGYPAFSRADMAELARLYREPKDRHQATTPGASEGGE